MNTNNLLKEKTDLSCNKNVMSVEMPRDFFILRNGMMQIYIYIYQIITA